MMPPEDNPDPLNPYAMFGAAIALYLLWVLATYILEGRIHLLISGDPVARVAYALIANLVVGTVIAVLLVNRLIRDGRIQRPFFGFQPGRTTLYAVVGASVLGLLLLVLQGSATLNPVILLNVFAQVFNTSIAEILVCFVLIGVTGEFLFQLYGRITSLVVGIVLAAVFFGLYHFAHSPPYDTLPLVALLTGVGLLTGVFYFLVRELYATIVFHNFLALFGVVQNVDLSLYQEPQYVLFGLMVVSVAVLVGMDVWYIRRIRTRFEE